MRQWIMDGKWGWISFLLALVLAVALLTPHGLLQSKELDVRVIGLVMQLYGFFIVLVGIAGVSSHFKRPTFPTHFLAYWRRFPRIRLRRWTHEVKPCGLTAPSPILGQPRVGVEPAKDTPTSQRVAILEQTVDGLIQEIETFKSEHRNEVQKMHSSWRSERSQRETALKNINHTFDVVIADTRLEWLGVLYFIAGSILATLSNEVAYCLTK